MSKRAQQPSKRSAQRSSPERDNVLDFQPMARKQRGVGKTYEAPKRMECKTEAQAHFLMAIQEHVVTFGLGPAGVGKSHIPVAYGVELLQANKIDKIIITRPMQGCDEGEIGALPGDLDEKVAPWFSPIRIILEKQMGKGAVECQLKLGNILVKPLQFLRGNTFENALVLLDEAQNTTPKQMEMFLTRIGDNCRVVINGDLAQQDTHGVSGLRDAILKLHGSKSKHFAFRVFERKDIIRHPVVMDVLNAYQKKLSAADVRLMSLLQGDRDEDTDA